VTGLPAELAAKTVLTWVDERHLAADPDSNRKLAWDRWLSKASTRPREVPLDAPGPLDQARAAVEAAFRAEVGRLDVVVLGVGPDGHVASLFPGRAALDDPGTVLAVPDSPKPPPERLTLGRTVLEDADLVVVVAAGAAKGPVLAKAAARDPAIPLGRLTPRGRYVWVLDRAAAEAARLG
jgi:6-phosphogluconolactonase